MVAKMMPYTESSLWRSQPEAVGFIMSLHPKTLIISNSLFITAGCIAPLRHKKYRKKILTGSTYPPACVHVPIPPMANSQQALCRWLSERDYEHSAQDRAAARIY